MTAMPLPPVAGLRLPPPPDRTPLPPPEPPDDMPPPEEPPELVEDPPEPPDPPEPAVAVPPLLPPPPPPPCARSPPPFGPSWAKAGTARSHTGTRIAIVHRVPRVHADIVFFIGHQPRLPFRTA